MSTAADEGLLGALLDSWDRNSAITVNLLPALPAGSLDLRAADGSPTVAEMFTHMHYCRVVFVFEDAPEIEGGRLHNEWAKQAGRAFDDEEIGPSTWDVWMDKKGTAG